MYITAREYNLAFLSRKMAYYHENAQNENVLRTENLGVRLWT